MTREDREMQEVRAVDKAQFMAHDTVFWLAMPRPGLGISPPSQWRMYLWAMDMKLGELLR